MLLEKRPRFDVRARIELREKPLREKGSVVHTREIGEYLASIVAIPESSEHDRALAGLGGEHRKRRAIFSAAVPRGAEHASECAPPALVRERSGTIRST